MKLLQLILGVTERGHGFAGIAGCDQTIRLLDQPVDTNVFLIRILLGEGRKPTACQKHGRDAKKFHAAKMPEENCFGNRAACHTTVTCGIIDRRKKFC